MENPPSNPAKLFNEVSFLSSFLFLVSPSSEINLLIGSVETGFDGAGGAASAKFPKSSSSTAAAAFPPMSAKASSADLPASIEEVHLETLSLSSPSLDWSSNAIWEAADATFVYDYFIDEYIDQNFTINPPLVTGY